LLVDPRSDLQARGPCLRVDCLLRRRRLLVLLVLLLLEFLQLRGKLRRLLLRCVFLLLRCVLRG